jgi:hypothetical protein
MTQDPPALLWRGHFTRARTWFIGLNLLEVAGLIRVWRDRHLHLHS